MVIGHLPTISGGVHCVAQFIMTSMGISVLHKILVVSGRFRQCWIYNLAPLRLGGASDL